MFPNQEQHRMHNLQEIFTDDNTSVVAEGVEVLDLGDDFNLDDYQVVRREFFAHLREPSVSFADGKFSVNMACISKFPNTDFVQVLINKEKKILALRPCSEGERDCFQWCKYNKNNKRMPKQFTCRLFFAKIFTLMEWNPDFRYKLLGSIVHSKGQYMLAFDLSSTEVYQRTFTEGERTKKSRTPVYPASWQNQFGLPYSEHRQSMQINVFDGYAIYSVKDNAAVKAVESKETVPAEAIVPVYNATSGGGWNNG